MDTFSVVEDIEVFCTYVYIVRNQKSTRVKIINSRPTLDKKLRPSAFCGSTFPEEENRNAAVGRM